MSVMTQSSNELYPQDNVLVAYIEPGIQLQIPTIAENAINTQAITEPESLTNVGESVDRLVQDVLQCTDSSHRADICQSSYVGDNEHATVLLSTMQQLRAQGLLLDTCVTCNGQSLLAHHSVLGAYSQYIYKISTIGVDFSTANKLQIQLDVVSFPVLEWIVNYMYSGDVTIPQSCGKITAETVLCAAKYLQMPQLLSVLENDGRKKLCSTKISSGSTSTQNGTTGPKKKRKIPLKSPVMKDTVLDCLDEEEDLVSSEPDIEDDCVVNKHRLRPRRKSARSYKDRTSLTRSKKITKKGVVEDQTYKCYHCHLTYSHRKSMHDHVRASHANISRPFPCRWQHCDFLGVNPAEVHRHVIQNHPEIRKGRAANKNVTCPHCTAVYSHIKTMQNHIRSVHGDIEKPFVCDVQDCHYAARDNKELYQHKMELHYISKLKMVSTLSQDQIQGRKVFSCSSPGCGYKTINRKSIKCHQRRHDGILPYQCTYCEKAFVERKSLKGHETTHTGEKNHKCDFCVQMFGLRKSLVEHIRNVHKNIEKPFLCPHNECKFASESNKQLYAHRLEVHRSDLIQTKEEEDPNQCYICPVCGKECKNRDAAKMHQKIHTQAGLFKCDKCVFSASMKQSLRAHMNRIHGIEIDGTAASKAFCCDVCGISYFTAHELTVHVRREHTMDRPFQCKYCKFATTQKGNLIRHERLHTGEKPFECNLCEKSFVSQSGLARHKRAHAGIKPHTCSHCGQSFAERKNLVRHTKRLHPTAELPPRLSSAIIQRVIKDTAFEDLKNGANHAPIQGHIQGEGHSQGQGHMINESPTIDPTQNVHIESRLPTQNHASVPGPVTVPGEVYQVLDLEEINRLNLHNVDQYAYNFNYSSNHNYLPYHHVINQHPANV